MLHAYCAVVYGVFFQGAQFSRLAAVNKVPNQVFIIIIIIPPHCKSGPFMAHFLNFNFTPMLPVANGKCWSRAYAAHY